LASWDIDRYEQLQNSAWELELFANEQHGIVDRQGGEGSSAMSRAQACALRQEAAGLLAQYWLPRTRIAAVERGSS
jgi:hypothetical protein